MAYTKYEPIEFENGTLVSPGSVNLETRELTMPVYSGKAPVNATNLNHLEQGLVALENFVLTSGISSGGGNEPVGTIKMWTTENAPNGYLICQGQAVSRTEYSDLFNIIGTTYGAGDGSTTFNIPDYRDRVPVGLNVNSEYFNSLGKTGGEVTHTLTIEELPKSELAVKIQNFPIISNKGANETYTDERTINFNVNDTTTESILKATLNGGNQPHNNLQPYIVQNYIIKATKVTPTQAEVEDSLESDSTENAPSIHAINEALNNVNGVLLWENPSPTNIYGATTISLDLSKYKFFIIESYRYKIVSGILISTIVFMNEITQIAYSDYDNSVVRVWNRNVEVTANDIIFGTANINGGEDNFALVPYRIWGFE